MKIKFLLLLIFASIRLPSILVYAEQTGVEIIANVEEPKKVQYSINVTVFGLGEVQLNKNKASQGEVITLIAKAKEGYTFSHYKGCNSNGTVIMPSEDIYIEVYFIKTPTLPTITILPTSPPTFISPRSHPIITTKPTEIPILPIGTLTPQPTRSLPAIITIPISTPTNPSIPLPTDTAKSEELPKPITNWIPIIIGTSASSFGGIGLLLFLLLRKRRTWHGVFTEDMLPYMKIRGIADSETRENWFLPELADKLSNNEITIEEYIETVLHCGVVTILPYDAKMTIIIGEETRILPAIEYKFLSILKEAHTNVSFTLTSVKSGMRISIEYNNKMVK